MINKKIQPVIHREIQPVIKQNIQPIITKEIQPIINRKIQAVIFTEGQTNIEEIIQQLERSTNETEIETHNMVKRESKTIEKIEILPFIQRNVVEKEETIVVPEVLKEVKNVEKIVIEPYIQYKNGEILPYEKKKKEQKDISPIISSGVMETVIAVNFISLNYNINYPMACKKSDIFSKIEKKLYQEFPDLKSKNIYFRANGNVVDKSSTFEQNNIKSGNTILINEVID